MGTLSEGEGAPQEPGRAARQSSPMPDGAATGGSDTSGAMPSADEWHSITAGSSPKDEERGATAAAAPDAAGPSRYGIGRRKWKRRLAALGVLLLALAALLGLPPLLAWQQTNAKQARSLSNIRRLAETWQMYAQDWDGFSARPIERRADGTWLTWTRRLRPYGANPDLLDNPANPLPAAPNSLHDPQRGFNVDAGYALNRRFWDTFAPGPFPVDNLELPAQTVLFVEAGPMSPAPRRAPNNAAESKNLACLVYSDTLERAMGLILFPSTHSGKMLLVAADGHAAIARIEHYDSKDGPHDPLYGRVGGDLYNWNGGHPNGQTEQPPRD